MLANQQGSHPLGLSVIGVVVAGRQRVGAEHDPPLRFITKACIAGLLDHLTIRPGLQTRAVAYAVVPGKVRGGFRRSDQVIARHAVVERERQIALADLGAELAGRFDRGLERGAYAGFDPGQVPDLLWDPDSQTGQTLGRWQLDRLRQLDGRRVVDVASRDDRVQQCRVADGLRNRTDLVEA